MKFSTIFYSLALARTIFAHSSFNQDLPILAHRKSNVRNTRNLDDVLIRSLLPRTTSGKSPGSRPSSAPVRGTKPSNHANQGLPSRSTSAVARVESNTESRPRGGEASVNSSPAREQSSSAAKRGTSGSGKRPGHTLADGRPAYRQRLDLTHRGGHPVLSPEVAPQTIDGARSIPVAGRNNRTHTAAQGSARGSQLPPDSQGGTQHGIARQQNSPNAATRLQSIRQQMQAESQRLLGIPGPPRPSQFPERRLPVARELQNQRPNHWGPDPFGPNHPWNFMYGMAARIAAGPGRPPAINGQAAAVGQAGGVRQGAGGPAGVAGGQGIGGIQGAGHGALGAGAVANQGQGPQPNQDIRPIAPASPSTASTQNHLE